MVWQITRVKQILTKIVMGIITGDQEEDIAAVEDITVVDIAQIIIMQEMMKCIQMMNQVVEMYQNHGKESQAQMDLDFLKNVFIKFYIKIRLFWSK